MGEQAENLARVKRRIKPTVLGFCQSRVGESFHMEDLVSHVQTRIGIAPDSPSRILRDLRQHNLIDYVVVNRAQSLYLLLRA